MFWNNRIRKRVTPGGDPYYDIVECYYDDDNKIYGWTETSIAPHGNTKKELKQDLEWMLKAFDSPVIDEKKESPKVEKRNKKLDKNFKVGGDFVLGVYDTE